MQIYNFWVDEPRHQGFCLFEAPNANAVIELHKNAHGMSPNRINRMKGDMISIIFGENFKFSEISNLNELGKLIVETPYRTLMMVDAKSALLANNI